ncbi:MAG: UDP-3-O-(3-hydroxymyristoyl)glucosamine N-acyltransferase [Crocinitomicaceae bacterium]|nr:UDP-3-O-(3-hydroxymyristoyl)glucosamine N-acyltransferase [Crocinitomicaceae bacterium]
MKFDKAKSLKEIADFLGCQYKGNTDIQITGINEIHRVEPGDIVFVDHPKYYQKALESAADIILIDQEVEVPEGKAILISDHPFDDFNKITKHYSPFTIWSGHFGKNSTIGENSHVFPNATVGDNVTIGKNTIIHAGAVIGNDTIIGDNVIVGPNAVIGFDAFYYKKKDTGFDRLHSCGRAILEDNVEIGALTTVDKGASHDTIIGKGSKLDNQVHIGHDTVIGENCLFAANVGVAGCVTIGNNVTLWGQVGVVSDIHIGDGAVVLGQSGVGKSLEPNKTYFGSPADEARQKWKELAAFKRLPSIIENL